MSLAPQASGAKRVQSVDILRGLVMVLMSIDHVRVYSGLPAGGPTEGIFFTRWITHFCAPVFVFLAGTSAFFYATKRSDLPRFLVSRGLWLILLEFTYLRFMWAFNLESFWMAGVIWVIGACMILLAGLSRLSASWIAVASLVLIAAPNLLDTHLDRIIPAARASSLTPLWSVLYLGFWTGPIALGGNAGAMVLYSLVPWIGVMGAGFAFGNILRMERARRDPWCYGIGLVAVAAFLLLRAFNLYGDPRAWNASADATFIQNLMAFLNTNKYPASLLFLLMTLGPAIASIPLIERYRGRALNPLVVFGRVPFFYYMLHIPLIHLLAMLVSRVRLGGIDPWLFANHPLGPPEPPAGYTWGLPLLYGITLVANLILYPLCRWFGALKARHPSGWLRFL
jgi:uncharacterized membrane protein